MNIKPGAVTKLRELFAEENKPGIMLRVFVQGGGCSGFSYGFTFEETQAEDDFDFVYEEVKIVVDAMSMQYLTGADIDFNNTTGVESEDGNVVFQEGFILRRVSIDLSRRSCVVLRRRAMIA